MVSVPHQRFFANHPRSKKVAIISMITIGIIEATKGASPFSSNGRFTKIKRAERAAETRIIEVIHKINRFLFTIQSPKKILPYYPAAKLALAFLSLIIYHNHSATN